MSRNKIFVCAIVIICILTYLIWRKKASDEMDFGTFEGSLYCNEYFGMTITIPSGWSIQDKQGREQLMRTGRKIISGDDKNLDAMLKASESEIINLFAAFKHPFGAPVQYNPSITCAGERISRAPGIRSGKDYLFHVKKLLQSGQIKWSFPKKLYSELLGGIEFDVMSVELTTPMITVKQEHYATIIKE